MLRSEAVSLHSGEPLVCQGRGRYVVGKGWGVLVKGPSLRSTVTTAPASLWKQPRLGKCSVNRITLPPCCAAVGSRALLLGMPPADEGVTCNWREASSCPLLWSLLSWTLVHCALVLCSSSLILECGERRGLFSALRTPCPTQPQEAAVRPGAERLQQVDDSLVHGSRMAQKQLLTTCSQGLCP